MPKNRTLQIQFLRYAFETEHYYFHLFFVFLKPGKIFLLYYMYKDQPLYLLQEI